MVVRVLKVAPAPSSSHNLNAICFCKTISFLRLARLLGLFPIGVQHQDGKCLFKTSLFWSLYTSGIACFFAYEVFTTKYNNLVECKSLLPLLDDLTNAMYGYFLVFALVLIVWYGSDLAETMNHFSTLLIEDVYCSSARRKVILTQYAIFAAISVSLLLQAGVVLLLNLSTSYTTDFSFGSFVLRLTQNVSLMIYGEFALFVAVVVGTLACFETMLINSLGCVSVHPTRRFLGIFPVKLCEKDHKPPANLARKELVEHLRIAHQEICVSIYKYNECVNVFLLVNTVVELVLLIVHWYAVILYMVYTFKNSSASTIHVLNCLFVWLHSWGIFSLLKGGQDIKNMIQRLIPLLLEYSMRISDEDEYLQVRFFIEKLKQHRHFTACRIFSIDLGIAGPILANILTYVLVALQFEVLDE